MITIVGKADSELPALAAEIGIETRSVAELSQAKPGEAVWLLPASYPHLYQFDADQIACLHTLLDGGSKILVEFDSMDSSDETEVRRCHFERIVVRESGHSVVSSFSQLSLLEAHQAFFSSTHKGGQFRELCSIARVSGFDSALYGLPEITYPALVEYLQPAASGTLLWAATSISSPSLRRYKPLGSWNKLLLAILAYLDGSDHLLSLPEIPEVRIPPQLEEKKKQQFFKDVIGANLAWYEKSGMLLSPDGSSGVLEGFHSNIDIDGRQYPVLHNGRANERADCNIQSAVAFLLGGREIGKGKYTKIGQNLLNFSIQEFQYHDAGACSGLWRWFRTGYESTVFYSDDNGWAAFFLLYYGSRAGDPELLKAGLRTAVALKETWGANGHRRRRIDGGLFFDLNGRAGLRNEVVTPEQYRSPHYEATAMAGLALASCITGDPGFMEVMRSGLDDYLSWWPREIFLQHSLNDDGSKLIIALIFAGQATGECSYWNRARQMLEPFLNAQLKNGAIPEIDPGGERYGKNRSNEDYGTFESSVFQEEDDIVTDQVYGSSFMLLALHFSIQVFPEDQKLQDGYNRLAEYLGAIQLRDTGRDFLDGAWMRAFDPVRWEYFGAAGDWAYGPYLIETGWCQAIIVLGLSLLLENRREPQVLPGVSEMAQALLPQILKEQKAVEKEWRSTTPRPEVRTLAEGEPDPLI